MSNIYKQALRERYSAKPTPKCHICGTEMTVQRMSASRITYGCTGSTYGDTGCHYAAGRSIADDHYEQSRITIVDVSDPDVLALLDELEAKDKLIAELTESLKQTVSGYKSCLRTGHDRILDLGGECDAPEVMIVGNPDIRQAEKLLAAGIGKGE